LVVTGRSIPPAGLPTRIDAFDAEAELLHRLIGERDDADAVSALVGGAVAEQPLALFSALNARCIHRCVALLQSLKNRS
jgi:hypothetical protein